MASKSKTTIQVTQDVVDCLKEKKVHDRQPYNEVLEGLLGIEESDEEDE